MIFVLLLVVFLSIGYSSYNTNMFINDVSLTVRLNKDIRVTGVSVVSSDGDGISNYENYNVSNVMVGVSLPNLDSYVIYKVNITNFEEAEMGILDIDGLPSNLEYSIINDSYTLKEKFCVYDRCNLGISKDIYIKVNYKDGGYDSSNTVFDIDLKFDFRQFYSVIYENISGNYQSEILDGDSLIVNFGSDVNLVRVYIDGIEINDFLYDDGILTVDNVYGNVKVSTYVERPYITNTGLYPVKYVNNKWIVCDSDDNNWYNYMEQEWANAVILNDNVSKEVGDEVLISSEVRAMFVWIPRYEYKISTDGSNEIYIRFISTGNDISSDGYLVHPAFSFGNDNLSGIWFGKFETSASKTSNCYLNTSFSNCNNNNQEPYIIPGVKSLREQTVYYQYLTAKKIVNYLDASNGDSHMVKSSEWGAVAYLSQSKYGKYGNNNYLGDKKEVYANTSSDLYTGMSDGGGSSNIYSYDYVSYDEDGEFVSENGVGASTTGNITGIYDMNGGTYEYVMSYLTTASSTFGASSSWNAAGFSSSIDSKYYDAFTSTNVNTACNGTICYGLALSETMNWYDDSANFVTGDNPWLMRGGVLDSGSLGGMFSYDSTVGYSGSYATFRIALVFTS